MKMKILIYGIGLLLSIVGLYNLISAKWFVRQNHGNWEMLAEAAPMAVNALPFSHIFFFDKDNGISITPITIQKTSDSGKNWTSIRNWDSKGFHSLIFTDNQHGWIVGSENDKPLVLKTENKGLSWQDWKRVNFDEKSLIELNGKFTTFFDICFDLTGKGWMVGDGGIVEAIANGHDWKASSIFPTKDILYSVSCNDSGEVWAVGEHGAIFHYQNDWMRKEIDKKYLFQKVISSGNDIWILGGINPPVEKYPPPGILLRSRDNGQTWENKTPESASLLFDLFLKDGKGWLVGAKGDIFYSSDNGNSWIKSSSPTQNDLRQIFFLDPQNGWIIGNKATVLHLSNN